jgi:hypothetical protein
MSTISYRQAIGIVRTRKAAYTLIFVTIGIILVMLMLYKTGGISSPISSLVAAPKNTVSEAFVWPQVSSMDHVNEVRLLLENIAKVRAEYTTSETMTWLDSDRELYDRWMERIAKISLTFQEYETLEKGVNTLVKTERSVDVIALSASLLIPEMN